MIHTLEKYCNDILSGEITSGIHVKNAVSRFRSDLTKAEENGWYFDESSVIKVINFIHTLKHSVGKYAGKHFTLQPWQVFIVANLYGFYNNNGTRRFQTAYLEMARKQGKTAFVAALALYNLLEEGEEGSEILLAANSKEQARIAFEMTKYFALSIDPESKILKTFHSDIVLRERSGCIKALAAEPDKLDGYNCSLGIIDEYHEARNSKVRDVIRSSQGMRDNPLLITITTAGFDKSLPCYDLHNLCGEIIAGVKTDETFFGMIFALDDADDWRDPNNWQKANPNLNITVTSKFIETQVKQAVNNPTDEVGVKTKNLNIWCDSSTTWIPEEYIIKATKKLNIDDFKDYKYCYVGVDLSANVDLTAVSYLFAKGDGDDTEYYIFTDFYIPRETLDRVGIHIDKELYRQWADNNYLKLTAGNVTDYDYITKDMLEKNSHVDIYSVYYDKYNATSWAIQCTELGLNLEPYSQTIANFNIPTKTFERAILGGKLHIDDNPVMRYCLRNVELRRDVNGNIKPDKLKESKKIDGVISSLQAIAAYLEFSSQNKGTNIY